MALDSEILLNLPETVRKAEVVVEPALRGFVLVLIQFDVCEEIRLDELRQIFGARTVEQAVSNARSASLPPLTDNLQMELRDIYDRDIRELVQSRW